MTTLAPRRPESATRERFFTDVPFTKAPTVGSGDLELSGYASTWGMDRDDEYVAPAAFEQSLPAYLGKNPMLLWQHNIDWPIGTVTSAKTDDTGLYVTAIVPNPGPDAADWQRGAYTAIKLGVVKTFSIGGYFTRDVKPGPDGPVFIIEEVELFEISCVSIPANADSIYEAAVKAVKDIPPRMGAKAHEQLAQLVGAQEMTDPELGGMGEEQRSERYELLARVYKRVYGIDAPRPGALAQVAAAAEAAKRIPDVVQRKLALGLARSGAELVADLLEHPERYAESNGHKAGRAISAANRQKLEGALAAHGKLEDSMIDAAESMKSAAGSHAEAMKAIQEVLGVSDDGDEPAEGGDDADEPPDSPEKAKQKQLTRDLFAALRSAGVERFRNEAEDTYVFVDDFDLDEGYVVYCVYGPDTDTYLQVPFTRGEGGSVFLAAGQTEVTPASGYRPKRAAELAERQEALLRDRAAASGQEGASEAERKAEAIRSGVPFGEAAKGAADELIEEAVEEEAAEGKLDAEHLRDLRGAVYAAKSALPLSNLPIADRERPWSAPAAKRAVHAKAEREGGGYDPAILAKAYLWRDNGAPNDQASSYRFIVCDVLDGTLTYIPRAIFAAAAVVQGARGGTSTEIADAIKPLLERLYSRLATKFQDDSLVPPWKEG